MKTTPFKSVAKIAAFFGILVLFSACNSKSYNEDLAMESVDVSETYAGVDQLEGTEGDLVGGSKMPADLKIIKSAAVKYKVDDVKVATAEIKKLATKYNAYISDLRFQNNLYQIENRFTVKVPEQHFDEMMNSFGDVVSFVEYENITTKDVTEEFIDIQSRLKTKMEVKQRYEEVLRRNAKTVKDILDTEEKLRVIQEEIEAAQGRLKYLTSKVAYSTIQIDLYETVEYKDEPTSYKKSFADKSKNGFAFGWEIIEGIVLGAIHMWPLILFGLILFFFLRRYLKKKN